MSSRHPNLGRLRRRSLGLGLIVAAAMGCQSLAGLDDFVDQDGGTAAGIGTGTTTGSSTATTTGSGRGGSTTSGTATGSGGGGTGGSGSDPCAVPDADSGVLFFSTLDDADSIESPARGSGANAIIPNVSSTPLFVAARCGNGARFEEAGERIQLARQVEPDQGTITFWLQAEPLEVNRDRKLFSSMDAVVPGLIRLRFAGSGQFEVLQTDHNGSSYDTTVDVASFSMPLGPWVHVRVTWNAAANGQMVHVYFDGLEPSYAQVAQGPIVVPTASMSNAMFIGAFDDNDSALAPLVTMDELGTFDVALPP
jgi:hypothetical protein